MTHIARRFLILLFALLAATPAAFAQAQRTYSQAELDQMLAPIALYPDPLLSQVLMAATYPAEVREAARWSRANPGLQGDDAVRAAQNEDWDPSVQSLVAFPQILAQMDENPAWTQSLGDAFLLQEPHVMDTVQQLRRRAQAAGNLQSSEQMYVQQQGQAIVVLPASPQYVYVPYYDPLVVYGPWWWPAYQPVVWAPWPGYARPYRSGISVGFWWGTPVGLSLNFFFGDFDWGYRQVRVVYPSTYYYRSAAVANRTLVATPQRWQHEPRRREVVIERQPVQVRQPVQAQPQLRREERRQETGIERRDIRQERIQTRPQAPASQTRQESRARMPEVVAPLQPRAERQEQRQERRFEQQRERQQSRPQANALPSIQAQPAAQAQPSVQARPRAQPEVRPQPQARPQPEARPQPQVRQEQRPRMPEAQAPQLPRAERKEQRQERRELRQERQNERVHKVSEPS